MINFYDQDTDLDIPRYYALKQACKFGVLSTVRSILHSEDSARQDRHQSEPFTQRQLQKCLFEAFTNRYFDVARYLIREAGVEIEPIEKGLANHASKERMPVETFEFLLQEGWDINSTICEFRTALRMPVLKRLVNLGYDPNASDIAHNGPRTRGPPLHWAARGGSVENARFLLENGADPWGQNPQGLNALEAAELGCDPTGEGEMLRLIKEFMKG